MSCRCPVKSTLFRKTQQTTPFSERLFQFHQTVPVRISGRQDITRGGNAVGWPSKGTFDGTKPTQNGAAGCGDCESSLLSRCSNFFTWISRSVMWSVKAALTGTHCSNRQFPTPRVREVALVVFRNHLEVSLRVLADGTFLDSHWPFMNEAAVPTPPLDLVFLLKHRAAFNIAE